MAEEVILWVIESLDGWLLKKRGLAEEMEKLYRSIVGISYLGVRKKKVLHTFLLQFSMEREEEDEENENEDEYDYDDDQNDEEDKDEDQDEKVDMEKLYNLLNFNKRKMYRLLVKMADFWEDNKGKLYHLLFRVGKRDHNLGDTTGQWGEYDSWFDIERLNGLLFEIADLWGDDEGELNKEKLHSLLFQILLKEDNYLTKEMPWNDEEEDEEEEDENEDEEEEEEEEEDEDEEEEEEEEEEEDEDEDEDEEEEEYSKIKMMRRISGEVAGLWKDKQPKLNKEKLYTWLANKVYLCECRYLFDVLLDTVRLYYSSSYDHTVIREGVEGVKRELGEILDLIRDKKLGEETSLRYFISDVVDMAHDAHFVIHLQDSDSDPFALFFELSVLVRDHETHDEWFGEKFKHIAQGLQEIKVSMLRFGVERLQNVREMEGGENVVGLEEDAKLLLCDEYNCEITVIKGMAGIGKTTLARQVYNHPTIAQQFERRAWVCLSTVFSRKEMLASLIQQVVDSNELASLEEIERADYKSLKQVLRQQLLGMRYFIVLDDVWDNKTHFEYVMKALPRDKGSRLLLTTRKGSELLLPTLTNYYNRVHYHKMKSMDADESWRLLLKTLSIEGSDEQFPKPLVKKARQILGRKCGGLPLAIKEVGRHWAKKRQSGSEWEELIESIDLTETLRALESCYHDWDQELQSCFLHLAFFKECATIRAKRLLHIWTVMGVFTRCNEIYESLLKRLWKESIINLIKDSKGNIRSVHVVFHMLSIRKAKDELNFEILSKDGNSWHSHQPHHRAIYCSREKLMNYSNNQDKHLVSLFFYGGGYFNSSPSYWKYFEQLKTLDMEDFGLKILPDVIGMLSELRYLGLRNNYIQVLPHSLSRLKKLEVLDIALNFMVEVEDIIWEMESLLHLYMTDTCFLKSLRIDTLKYLKTWTYVSVHNLTYEVSRSEMMMSHLTKLGIQDVDGNTDLSKLFAFLAEFLYLRILILRGFRFKSMPSLDEIGILRRLHELKLEGLITRLPSANNFPQHIECLSLVNSCLHEDPMPILEKLSSLIYLKLQNAYTGQQMVISGNGFSELESLVIEELWHLTNVQIEKGAMKKLKAIEINSCPNLETLPEDYLPMDNMEMFKMKTTKKNATKIRESSFVSRVREVGEVDIQP